MAIYMWRDVQEREPTADTYVYLPLTTTDTYTNYGTAGAFTGTPGSFGTYTTANVNCLKLNADGITRRTSFRSGSFSVAIWVNSANQANMYFSGVSDLRLRYLSNGGFAFTSVNSSGSYVTKSLTTDVSIYTWYLVVAVYEKTGATGNGNMYYYVKGNNLDRTETSVQRNDTYSNSIVLGNYTSGASGLFNGYLSKFIIEDKVWTAQDINNYYITTKANYGL